MDNTSPTIAVVIPYYNRVRFIGEAIASVRNQTRAANEIIVVDDGSHPKEAAFLSQFENSVTVIRQANRGAAAARNRGVAAASSEWIAFLDDDDLWDAKRLEVMSDYISAHPECLALHNAVLDLETGLTYRKQALELHHFLHAQVSEALPSSTMVRRDELLAAGLMNPAVRLVEDHDCFLRVSMHCRFHYVDLPLTIRRKHEGSISRDLLGVCRNQNRMFASYRHLFPDDEDYRRQMLVMNREFLVTAVYERNWPAAGVAWRMAGQHGVSRSVLVLTGLKRLLAAKVGGAPALQQQLKIQ